ncbi:MAG TPA: CBS domain-containing protein [Verrucomicrobiota bacterium]|nr:CBS domain-containing protein [Verrucomicrobiota bacterium]HOK76712.1 CBS domain-containing protein [Verrucomicrobiota bacterium]
MKITGTVEAVLQLKGWNVCSVGPEDTVFEAIRRMAEANVGALVVLEGGKLIGVISERDYTRKVALQGRSSKQTSVREILTGNPYTVSPETSVEECLKIMSEKKIRHLPVLRGDAVVGVISVSDLVDWIIKAQRAAIDQLESYISGRYPA